MSNGWRESATAWIAEIGDRGDFSRQYVLDAPMMEWLRTRHPRAALDIGCGEGRFCRMVRRAGIAAVGVDPVEQLISEERRQDPDGDYRLGEAEALAFPDAAFDAVVSYLTLIDIPDIETAIAEMNRVLRPGRSLLIANLTSFSTASKTGEWSKNEGRDPVLHRPLHGGTRTVARYARHPNPQLAPAVEHLDADTAQPRPDLAALRRAAADGRRTGQGRPLSTRTLALDDGMGEAVELSDRNEEGGEDAGIGFAYRDAHPLHHPPPSFLKEPSPFSNSSR